MFVTEKAKNKLSHLCWILYYILFGLCFIIPIELYLFFGGIYWLPVLLGLTITFSVLYFKKRKWYFQAPLIFFLSLPILAISALLLGLVAGWWYLF